MKRLLTILVALAVMISCTSVYVSANEYKVEATNVSGIYAANDIIKITVSLDGFPEADTLSFILDYDKEVLEFLGAGSSAWLVSGTLADFDTNMGIGVFASANVTNVNTDVCEIAFKVLQTINTEVKVAMTVKKGSTTYIDHTYEDYIATSTVTFEHEHVWGEKVDNAYFVSAAGCETNAIYKKSCNICGLAHDSDTFEAKDTALGHTWSNIVKDTLIVTPADCDTGNIYKKSCSVCGEAHPTEMFEAKDTALGHTWSNIVKDTLIVTPADCDTGNIYKKSCSVCGEAHPTETFEARDTALGHTWGEKIDNAYIVTHADCENDAVYKKSCFVCGKAHPTDTFVDVDSAWDHDWSDWTDVPSDDEKHHSECENPGCDDTKSEDHSWDNGVITTPASCYKPGEKTYTCSVCGGTKTEVIPETQNHIFGDWEAKEGDDEKHYAYCKTSGCLEFIDEDHNFDNGVVTTNPSCYEEGVKTYTCVDCGYDYTEPVPATGNHVYGDWEAKEGDDKKHYASCETDGCTSIDSADHVFDNGVVTTNPSCYEEGVKTYTCVDCGYDYTEPVPATGNHVYGDWEAKEGDDEKHYAYCETDGCVDFIFENHDLGRCTDEVDNDEKHYQQCSDCDHKVYSKHNWDNGTVTKEPSCAEGEKTFTCSDCNGKKTEPVAATGDHVWGNWTTVDDLTHRRDCDNCDEFETGNHDVENGTSLGLTENHKHSGECTVCGDTDAQEACVWDNGIVSDPETCCEDGEKLYTCTSGCNGTKTEVIPATGNHDWNDWTDNEDGTHTRTCKNGSTSETFNHRWDEGTETKPATCYEEGEMTFECLDCDATMTEDIDKLDHVYGDPVSDDDDTHTVYCENYALCGSHITENHEYDNGVVTTDPSCYKDGVKTFTCDECDHTYTDPVPATGNHVLGAWVNSDDGLTHTRTCITEGCTESETHNYSANLTSSNAGHWHACADGCGEVYGYATHSFENDVCVGCGHIKPANQVISGYIYVNEDYHMMILTNGVIVSSHVLDENDICVFCLGHVPSEEDEFIEIVEPIEPSTEEEETDVIPEVTEPEENPETGVVLSTLALAIASLATAFSKKH